MRLLTVLGIMLLLCGAASAQCVTYFPDPAPFPFPLAASGSETFTVTNPNGSVNLVTQVFSQTVLFLNPRDQVRSVFGASGNVLFQGCNNVFVSNTGTSTFINSIGNPQNWLTTVTIITGGGSMHIVEDAINTVINADGGCPTNCSFDKLHYAKTYQYNIANGAFTINFQADRHSLSIDPSTGIRTEHVANIQNSASGVWPLLQVTAPQLAVTPSSIDFASVPLDQTRRRRLVIQNIGGSLLDGSVSTPSSPFVVTQGAGSFSLASGATSTVEVEFQPVTKGSFSDNITITSNDPLAPSVPVPLSGSVDDLTTVTVWIDAFIPWSQFGPLSKLLPPFFFNNITKFALSQISVGGDGRFFEADPSASFRVQWLETFDVATLTPVAYSTAVGTSHIVLTATGANLLSATPSSQAVAGYPIQVGSLVYVNVSGGAQFGFLDSVPGVPPINVDATFQIDLTNRTCQLVGTHGAFPAFEAYVQANNDQPVAVLRHNVGPVGFWPILLLGLYFPNSDDIRGTPVPF